MNPEKYLDRAAELAAQVDPHLTAPNPRVGCVIFKGDQILAEGTHQQYGDPHAEAHALKQLNPGEAAGAEAAVTLQPCHYYQGKKTPSCTAALIQAQIKKVWIGATDPHFTEADLDTLRQAGLEVEVLNTPHHAQLNPFFDTWITQHRPYICLKVAQTLDGRITNGQRHITSPASRAAVHQMRAQYSGVLTTTATVKTDDPQLNVRLDASPSEGRLGGVMTHASLPHPISNPRVLVMGQSGLPASLKLHQVAGRQIDHLQTRDLNELITFCRQEQIDSLMTECGGTLNAALLEAGLVDEIQIFMAPSVAGSTQTPAFNRAGNQTPLNLAGFKLVEQAALENDVWLRYRRS